VRTVARIPPPAPARACATLSLWAGAVDVTVGAAVLRSVDIFACLTRLQ
jgi:hypothetical protein